MGTTIPADKWKRRLEEEEDEDELVDRISDLPDDVLGDIISLLPATDGVRTQVLSSRWRQFWRSAPLNFDSKFWGIFRGNVVDSKISRILSAHPSLGRCIRNEIYMGSCSGTLPPPRPLPESARRFRHKFYVAQDKLQKQLELLDCWLQYPVLDNLQELVFGFGYESGWWCPPPPLPQSVRRRFSSTLRVASFGGCAFPEVNASAPLHFPVLKQLTLSHGTISEKSLLGLLAGCPALQSLLLSHNSGCSRARIVSPTLTSIGVNPGLESTRVKHLVLEDAPCLERLLLFRDHMIWKNRKKIDISVISAPRLGILGPLYDDHYDDDYSRFELGSTVIQGPRVRTVTTVVPSVKILALVNNNLSMDVVIGFLQCFPCLEKLYIKTTWEGYKNRWCYEYQNIFSTLDIRVKKVVLLNYRGNRSHVNFAKLFVLNAIVLESMVLMLKEGIVPSTGWIERQHKRLHTKYRACRTAQFDFVGHKVRHWQSYNLMNEEEAHDLSTADPFVRFRDWRY